MRRAFMIMMCVISASVLILSSGDEYSEWVAKYRPIFGTISNGKITNSVWVSQSMYGYWEIIYENGNEEIFEALDESEPGWRDNLVRDTCYQWMTSKRKFIYGQEFGEMKSYSTKSKDTTSFYVTDLLGPIWSYENNWPRFMADFSLREGDVFRPQCVMLPSFDRVGMDYPKDFYVSKVDSIAVRGQHYRRLTIVNRNNHIENRWVEGIGWQNGDIPGYSHRTSGYPQTKFIAKYEDDELVFTYDDFEAPAIGSSGAEKTHIDKSELLRKDKRMYDLQGHEIDTPQPGQVYIKGGKAYIAPKNSRK